MAWYCRKHEQDSVDDECPVCKREYYGWQIPQEYLDQTHEMSILKNKLSLSYEPWCYQGGGQAQMGECPTHQGDACLRTPGGLVEMLERANEEACDTQRSWKHRCYQIMSALGADYGDPDWVMPDDQKKIDHLLDLLKHFDIDPEYQIPTPYDSNYGDDKVCTCGHPYYRHFDTYEEMRPVGCKYCGCGTFENNSED